MVVQRLLDVAFEDAVLLLDHEDLFEALGERPDGLGVEGHRHRHLEQTYARSRNVVLGSQPEPLQCFTNLAIGDAARHDADPGIARIHRGRVEFVHRCVLTSQCVPYLDEVLLHRERVGSEKVCVWRVLVRLAIDSRDDGLDTVGIEVDAGRRIGNIGDDLQRAPHTGSSRKRDCMSTEVQRLTGIAGVEDRYVHIGEQSRRGRRNGRRLCARVVADERHGTAQYRGSCNGGVTYCVGGPIDTRGFAVPNANHTVVKRVALNSSEL